MVEAVRLDQRRKGACYWQISALLFAIMGILIREVSVGVNMKPWSSSAPCFGGVFLFCR